MDTRQKETSHCAEVPCTEIPELKRLNYFFGQMLGVQDFRTEQAYFREKLKLHNRCLHGYGTVCGLMVCPERLKEECEPTSDAERRNLEEKLKELREAIVEAKANGEEEKVQELAALAEEIKQKLEALPPAGCVEKAPVRVTVECGLALDCFGNEIIVRRPFHVDLWNYLSEADRKRVQNPDGATLYLSICYCEQPVDPVRPVLPDACGAVAECSHGKLRDAFKIQVSTNRPTEDHRCDSCCSPCHDPCLLLAVIRGFKQNKPVSADMIDNSVRRLLGTYSPTTITGISWTHGAEYSDDEAAQLLGTNRKSKGLKVTFSRPVLTSTLIRGVVDLWVIEGGRTRRAGMYSLEGDFEDLDHTQATVNEFWFRYLGDENLDPGDRVIITIRSAFILDECCQPVDGTNVGGRVPILPGYEFKDYDRLTQPVHCAQRPYGPWTSGSGAHGATFESWFYIKSDQSVSVRSRP